MTQIRIVTLDARIVVKEILAVLRHVPGFRGEQHLWIANTREWPDKVIPSTDDHIDAAVLTLISRAEWPRTEIRDLTRLLTRLYQAGWCNDAIVHLLDYNPDSTRVPPFNDGKTKHDSGLLHYLRRRLNRWRDAQPHSGCDDDYVPPTPVRRAVDFAEWAHRMHAVHGDLLVGDPTHPRPTPDLPPSTRRRRYDNYSDQVSPYGTRRVTALEMLAVTTLLQQDARSRSGPTPVPLAPSEWPADTSDRLPPGNMLVLLRDRAVHHALREFFGATDRDHWHTQALRTAIARAKHSGLVGRPITYPEVAELAAAITKPDGTPVLHNPDLHPRPRPLTSTNRVARHNMTRGYGQGHQADRRRGGGAELTRCRPRSGRSGNSRPSRRARFLLVIHRQGPAGLHAHPVGDVAAPCRNVRRKPRARVLVCLGPVRPCGHRDQGTRLVEVVGIDKSEKFATVALVNRPSTVTSMTAERDAADLRCLATLLDAHRQWESETNSRAGIKAMREWLWFYWQAPRHPRPLIRSKYPTRVPWSEAARRAIAENPKCGLVIEHSEPVSLVIRHLLDHPPTDADQLRDILDTRLACCVITKVEDQAINAAGFGTRLVPGAEQDPWARYRAAGIDPNTFAPYSAPENGHQVT